MFTDAQVQKLAEKVNSRFQNVNKQLTSWNLITTSVGLTRLIKDNISINTPHFYEVQLSCDPIMTMCFSKQKYQTIANIIDSSNYKSYVFLRTGLGIHGKLISQRVRTISKVEFYQTGLIPSKNPDPGSPYISPQDLPQLIQTKSEIPLDYIRTLFKEAGLYKVEHPFI